MSITLSPLCLFCAVLHCVVIHRVVSSEISLRKFPKIYSNLSGNFLNIFSLNNFLIITIEKNYKLSMFLTNNSPDLCVLTLCIKIRQNNVLSIAPKNISEFE